MQQSLRNILDFLLLLQENCLRRIAGFFCNHLSIGRNVRRAGFAVSALSTLPILIAALLSLQLGILTYGIPMHRLTVASGSSRSMSEWLHRIYCGFLPVKLTTSVACPFSIRRILALASSSSLKAPPASATYKVPSLSISRRK